MASFNRITLMGNLTQDPELTFSKSGVAVCKFNIAVNGNDKVLFIKVVAFKGTAENIGKFLKKGSGILVDGQLQMDNWEDKEGNKRSSFSVVASTVQFLGKPGESKDEYKEEYDKTKKTSSAKTEIDMTNINDISDDDIPF